MRCVCTFMRGVGPTLLLYRSESTPNLAFASLEGLNILYSSIVKLVFVFFLLTHFFIIISLFCSLLIVWNE